MEPRSSALVLDLQTGENAIFRPWCLARDALAKRRVWVCPLFEPFLKWAYRRPSPRDTLPELVELGAPAAMHALPPHWRADLRWSSSSGY